MLAQGTPAEVLLQSLLALGAAPLQDVLQRSNLEAAAASQALAELLDSAQLLFLEGESRAGPLAAISSSLVTSQSYWTQLAGRLVAEIEAYHAANPLRRGLPREELKSRLKLPVRLFNAALRKLVAEGAVLESGPLVQRPGHAIRLTPQQQRQVDALLKRFAASPYAPPTVKECQASWAMTVQRPAGVGPTDLCPPRRCLPPQ
jgi:selenocysteine-specific elongation factor